MAGPYSTEVLFEAELPPTGAIILKLFEITELIFKCEPVGDEGGFWRLICPITLLETHLLMHEQSCAVFLSLFDEWSSGPNQNTYLHQSVVLALEQLGGQPNEPLETWAGEPWDIAKWRWSPRHIDGRGRN